MSFQQFVCLSGLPRTGSTLLSALLSQNPAIHSEGNSAVCQLMWEMCQSVTNCKEQLQANNKEHLVQPFIANIPHFYYQNIPETIVVDKCRSWTHEPNLRLAKICIDPNMKVIVLERPIIEIVESFARLYEKSGFKGQELQDKIAKLLEPKSEPIMRSIQGIQSAKRNNDNRTFLFVQYNDFVTDPAKTIQRIYEFCGWQPFSHDFNNVICKYPENDDAYELKGQHDIRAKISAESSKKPVLINKEIIDKCEKIDRLLSN